MASIDRTVFTGWYCDGGTRRDYKTEGAEANRGLALRPLWWESVTRVLAPSRVVVVDSNSPVPPPDRQYFDGRLEHIRLLRNAGHPQNSPYHYSGWTASVLVGLDVAMTSDLDYFLYVEQDALMFGDRLLEKIEDQLRRHRFVFGDGRGTAWPLQVALFAIRKDGYRPFLSSLHRLGAADRQLAPELKFGVAAARSPFTRSALDLFARIPSDRWRTKFVRKTMKLFPEVGLFPFGCGRVRPIPFEDDCFYFQQGTSDELAAYAHRLGVAPPVFESPPADKESACA